MPPTSKISYKKVKEVAQKLEAEGIYPSNDRVRPITGGSSSTVAAYLVQWREEQETANLLEATVLDNSIKVSIHNEIDRQVKLNSAHLQVLLEQQKDSCGSMQYELGETHDEIDRLKSEIDMLTKAHANEVLIHEKKNTELSTREISINALLKTSTDDLAEVNRRLNDANKVIADLNQSLGKASGEIAHESQQNNLLQHKISDISGELRECQQKNIDLEKLTSKQEEQIIFLDRQLVEKRLEGEKLMDELRKAENSAAQALGRLDGIAERSTRGKKI